MFSLEDMIVTTDSSSEEIGEEPLDSSSSRGLVGDIQAIKKVVDVIQTISSVGEKVIPAIIEGQKTNNNAANKPTRFKLLKALKSDTKEEQGIPQE